MCGVAIGGAVSFGFQVRAMIPIDAGVHCVHARPRDRLLGLCELCQLLNRGLVLRNGGMAGHAPGRFRKLHAIARFGIGVTIGALQADREMRLVTVG